MANGLRQRRGLARRSGSPLRPTAPARLAVPLSARRPAGYWRCAFPARCGALGELRSSQVYEGERQQTKDCNFLGKFVLKGIQKQPAGARPSGWLENAGGLRFGPGTGFQHRCNAGLKMGLQRA